MLKNSNMALLRNFEILPDELSAVEICTNTNCAYKWTTEVCNHSFIFITYPEVESEATEGLYFPELLVIF
jgi:hypothetical protein